MDAFDSGLKDDSHHTSPLIIDYSITFLLFSSNMNRLYPGDKSERIDMKSNRKQGRWLQVGGWVRENNTATQRNPPRNEAVVVDMVSSIALASIWES